MKRLWPFALILLGITIVMGGFAYDVLFAGIPHQDPTPAIVAGYNFHAKVASTIRWCGMSVSAIGVVAMIVRTLLKKNHPTLGN